MNILLNININRIRYFTKIVFAELRWTHGHLRLVQVLCVFAARLISGRRGRPRNANVRLQTLTALLTITLVLKRPTWSCSPPAGERANPLRIYRQNRRAAKTRARGGRKQSEGHSWVLRHPSRLPNGDSENRQWGRAEDIRERSPGGETTACL